MSTTLIEASSGPTFTPRLTEKEAIKQAHLLKALANPTRLGILSVLIRHEGHVCVWDLAVRFCLRQPTMSHHLRILRLAGLVESRKDGLWAYYSVRTEALMQVYGIIDGLMEG